MQSGGLQKLLYVCILQVGVRINHYEHFVAIVDMALNEVSQVGQGLLVGVWVLESVLFEVLPLLHDGGGIAAICNRVL